METQLDIKEKWLDAYQKLIDAYVGNHQALVSEHMRAIFEYSKIAIHCSFFLNGGAAIAILYNSNSAQISQNVGALLGYCAMGAMLSALCAGISYLGQRIYFLNDIRYSSNLIHAMFNKKFQAIENYNADVRVTYKQPWPAHILSAIACGTFLLSLIFFYCALSKAFPSFKVIPFI